MAWWAFVCFVSKVAEGEAGESGGAREVDSPALCPRLGKYLFPQRPSTGAPTDADAAEDHAETLPMDAENTAPPAEPERVASPRRSANERRKADHGREVPEEEFTPSDIEDGLFWKERERTI